MSPASFLTLAGALACLTLPVAIAQDALHSRPGVRSAAPQVQVPQVQVPQVQVPQVRAPIAVAPPIPAAPALAPAAPHAAPHVAPQPAQAIPSPQYATPVPQIRSEPPPFVAAKFAAPQTPFKATHGRRPHNASHMSRNARGPLFPRYFAPAYANSTVQIIHPPVEAATSPAPRFQPGDQPRRSRLSSRHNLPQGHDSACREIARHYFRAMRHAAPFTDAFDHEISPCRSWSRSASRQQTNSHVIELR